MRDGTFVDKMGDQWTIEITVDGANTVRNTVQDQNGNPVDLYKMIGNSEVSNIFNTQTMIDIVSVLCAKQIFDRYSEEEYEKEFAHLDLIDPEHRKANVKTKAGRFFAARLTGEVLENLGKAFIGAMINFCPSEEIRQLLEEGMSLMEEQQREMYRQTAEEMKSEMPKMSGRKKPSTLKRKSGRPPG